MGSGVREARQYPWFQGDTSPSSDLAEHLPWTFQAGPLAPHRNRKIYRRTSILPVTRKLHTRPALVTIDGNCRRWQQTFPETSTGQVDRPAKETVMKRVGRSATLAAVLCLGISQVHAGGFGLFSRGSFGSVGSAVSHGSSGGAYASTGSHGSSGGSSGGAVLRRMERRLKSASSGSSGGSSGGHHAILEAASSGGLGSSGGSSGGSSAERVAGICLRNATRFAKLLSIVSMGG